jgi:UDP-N-acetylmuramoyl-L-alanyl-D-glutamate--2,6-diaminopimelate ligase
MKSLIKKFIPKFLLSWYHLSLAHMAAFFYGYPSEKIIVIGVTGTNGKSTTTNLISKILEEAGYKTALTSTVNFKVGDADDLNKLKMTMPGRFFLQRLLSDAVKSGCKFAIIESSSEGILQHRNIGIHYDCMVITNLTPEHIEAHGGFENYKNAKLEYFRNLEKFPHKVIDRQKVLKTIVVNSDDKYTQEFLNFSVDQKKSFRKSELQNIKSTEQGIGFDYQNVNFSLNLKGIFNFYNALAAITTASAMGVNLQTSKKALEKISNIPGRMELIDEGQNFKVLVDYAYEPEEMRQVYETIRNWKINHVIQVLGPSGGGRDKARIKTLGEMAGKFASTIFITTDDPYDDDPQKIGQEMFEGAMSTGKKPNVDLFLELDRREAIAKALHAAQAGDLVLITGKGSDQTMVVRAGYIPWDDREVVREEINKFVNH